MMYSGTRENYPILAFFETMEISKQHSTLG
jgi:hypothetical protein